MTFNDALEHINKQGTIDETIWYLKNSGLLAVTLPGAGLDFSEKNSYQLVQLLKAAGRVNLSLGRIYEGHINALYLIHLFATPLQKKRWFKEAGKGHLFGVWNAQHDDGLHISCTDNIFQLKGSKTFCSGAGYVTRALVTGSNNSGFHTGRYMWIVNTGKLAEESIHTAAWKPLGMQDSASYTINFNGYCDTADNLFGNTNDYLKQPFFTAGAIRFAAVQAGGAEALFNETVSYLKKQNRTNDPFQMARIAQMAVQLETGNNLLQQAAVYYDEWCTENTQTNKLAAYANMTRTAIEKICTDVIELSSKCAGARGLNYPNKIEQLIRDLYFYLRQPAPDASVTNIGRFVLEQNLPVQNIWNGTESFG